MLTEEQKQKRQAFLDELDELCDNHGFTIKLVLNYSDEGIRPAYKIVEREQRVPPPPQEEPTKEQKEPVAETPEPATPAEAQDKPVGEVLPEQPV